MSELLIPKPNEKQLLFLADQHKFIGYGGARGGGKSWAVRVKAALLCLNYPGIKVMIVRRTYPELQENHILPLCAMLRCLDDDPAERIAAYNDAKNEVDGLVDFVMQILRGSLDGEDPDQIEQKSGGCSGSCASCSGCH